MKSAKLYQFPRRARTASIPIVHSEDSFNTKKGSIKTNRDCLVEKGVALDYWASLVVFGPILAFA